MHLSVQHGTFEHLQISVEKTFVNYIIALIRYVYTPLKMRGESFH